MNILKLPTTCHSNTCRRTEHRALNNSLECVTLKLFVEVNTSCTDLSIKVAVHILASHSEQTDLRNMWSMPT